MQPDPRHDEQDQKRSKELPHWTPSQPLIRRIASFTPFRKRADSPLRAHLPPLQTILAAAVLVLVPLAIAPGILLFFDVTPKIFVLTMGAGALLWFCNPLASITWNSPSRSYQALLLAMGMQALWLVVTTAASADPGLSIIGGTWRRFGLLSQGALLVWSAVLASQLAQAQGQAVRRTLLRASAASAILVTLTGLLQYAIWSFDSHSEIPWLSERPYGTLGHPLYFSNFLLSPAILCIGSALEESAAGWKWLARGAVVLASLGIVLSGTRSGLVGLLLGWAALAVLSGRQYLRRYVPVIAAALVLAGLVTILPSGDLLRTRIRQWQTDMLGGPRLWLWKDTARMIAARPWLGYGPDTFVEVFPRHESAGFARAYPDNYHESPHNILLDAAVSGGAVGLVLILVLAGVSLHTAFRHRKDQPLWAGVALGATVAQCAAGQFACFTAPTALLFYFTILMPVSLEGSISPPAHGSASNRWLPRIERAVALAMVLFAAGVAATDLALGRVQRDFRNADLEAAMRDYRVAQSWSLPGFAPDLWYSRSLLFLGERRQRLGMVFEEALAAARRAAHTAEDRANACYHLAVLEAGQRDFAAAERQLRLASGWYPAWYKPYWLLAQILESGHRIPEALAYAEKAADLSGGREPQVDRYAERLRRSSAGR